MFEDQKPELVANSNVTSVTTIGNARQQLGRIVAVDLREIWTSEDKHFTPWLAQPENLELLGEALGIDLELEAQEKYVVQKHSRRGQLVRT